MPKKAILNPNMFYSEKGMQGTVQLACKRDRYKRCLYTEHTYY